MPPIKALLALVTHDNDYQRAQAASAETTARRLGVELETVFADGDAVHQIEQILTAIQRLFNRSEPAWSMLRSRRPNQELRGRF
jgi:hypothetical protein